MENISGIANMFMVPGRVNQMTSNLIAQKDKDGDSALTIDELGTFEDVFSKIDKNSDGKADKEELNAAFYVNQVNQMTSRMIMDKDKDGDTALNADEMGISSEEFAKVDKNSDGKIDIHELNTAHPFAQQYNKTLDTFKAADLLQTIGKIISVVS